MEASPQGVEATQQVVVEGPKAAEVAQKVSEQHHRAGLVAVHLEEARLEAPGSPVASAPLVLTCEYGD